MKTLIFTAKWCTNCNNTHIPAGSWVVDVDSQEGEAALANSSHEVTDLPSVFAYSGSSQDMESILQDFVNTPHLFTPTKLSNPTCESC